MMNIITRKGAIYCALTLFVVLLSFPLFSQESTPSDGRLTLIRELTGFASTVNSIVFTPNGKYIIAGGEDTSLRVWDVETGVQQQELFPHNTYIKDVAISPDGTRLVTASWDRQIIIYLVGEDGFLVQLETLTGFIAVIDQIAFLADSKTIVFGVGDGTLVSLDITNPEARTTVQLDALHIPEIEVAHYGDTSLIGVVTGFPDESVQIYTNDLTQPARIIPSEYTQGRLTTSIAFSPIVTDDKVLMATAEDGELFSFWEVPLDADVPLSSESQESILLRQPFWHTDLTFSSDGRLLFAPSIDGVIFQYDVSDLNNIIWQISTETDWGI
ncbi:MAG: hypothetical protein MUE54_12365, partial [Anaerolineae bacterium]|nr:hypothetical protein [Anaerolineae bacterium]